ncbi:MAG: DNA-processing protein DprA [Gemmatimonadota bacterium]|nr:DNA-processing protein DprA [Gemmatimonadota bacterium]MDE2986016.1 DNA-processing protein DprA [Gemmatimonadota bacterium]
MNGELSQNAQAILLLTAPLLAGGSRPSVKPLPLGDYNNLVRHLRDTEMQPAHLLDPERLRELDSAWAGLKTRRTLEDVRQLLDRGFLLAQALERWSARAIWVVTRPDDDYPNRLREKMRGKAPPVLYGCGDRNALDNGGLAVVGSRKVNEELIEYTERVGRLAAEAEIPIVSGGARGVDQAAMRGSLEAGGHAIGVLGNNLERAALDRGNRAPLMDGRLVLVSSFDPAVRFRGWQAMERNKQIYAMADAALVVNSDLGHGGTWAGATEQLGKLRYVTVYVRKNGEPCRGLDELVAHGAYRWSEPRTPAELHQIVSEDVSPVPELAGFQGELFPSQPGAARLSVVREGEPTVFDERKTVEDDSVAPGGAPVPGKNEMRLLSVMSGEMTRLEIREALSLKSWSNVKQRYLDPCRDQGWIEMTMPEKPRSPKQRFRLTPDGRDCLEALNVK